MTYIRGVRRSAPGHRLHDHLVPLYIYLDAIAIAMETVGGGAPSEEFHLLSERLGVRVRIPLPRNEGAVEHAIHGVTPVALELIVDELRPIPNGTPNLIRGQSMGFSGLTTYFACGSFNLFFEPYLHWLTKTCGSETPKWPAPLNFARLVRNASAHKGEVHFKNLDGPPVSWYGFTYSPTDQGRKIIGTEFCIGEMMVLMLETSEALDALGAPTL